MKRPALIAAAAVLVVAGAAAAVVASSSSGPGGSATGGYPWADAACKTATVSGTLSNGQPGTVCPNDDWEVGASIYNPASSYNYRNCTDYVAWKIKQTEGVTLPQNMGDASAWGVYFENHGNAPSSVPIVGDIAWESGGNHVAYVEGVSPDQKTVTISEYNEHYLSGHLTWGEGDYDTRTVPTADFQYIHVGIPSSNASSTSSSLSTPTVRSTTTTTSDPTDAFVHTWTWTGSTSDGFSESGTIQMGSPEPFKQGLTNGNDTAGSACTLDDTDAVIPTTITITNTTASLAANLGVEFAGTGTASQSDPSTDPNAPELDFEGYYGSGGATCDDSGEAQAQGGGAVGTSIVLNAANIPAGGKTSVDGFIILTQYYSPDAPGGTPSDLSDQLYLQSTTDSDIGNALTTYNVTGFSGPGAIQTSPWNDNQISEWAFNVGGTQASPPSPPPGL